MAQLLLVPLEDTVVFPTMDVTLPIDVGDAERVLLVPATAASSPRVGTVAEVTDRVRLPGGARAVSLSGVARGVAGAARADTIGRLIVEVDEHVDPEPSTAARASSCASTAPSSRRSSSCAAPTSASAQFLRAIVEPGALADTIGYAPDITFEQKVEVLETLDVTERLALAVKLQRERLAELQVRRRIRDDVQSGAEKQQREYFLRKQIESIRRSSARTARPSSRSTARRSTRPACPRRSRSRPARSWAASSAWASSPARRR